MLQLGQKSVSIICLESIVSFLDIYSVQSSSLWVGLVFVFVWFHMYHQAYKLLSGEILPFHAQPTLEVSSFTIVIYGWLNTRHGTGSTQENYPNQDAKSDLQHAGSWTEHEALNNGDATVSGKDALDTSAQESRLPQTQNLETVRKVDGYDSLDAYLGQKMEEEPWKAGCPGFQRS